MQRLKNGWIICFSSKRNDAGLRTVLAEHPVDGRYAVWHEDSEGELSSGLYSGDISIVAEEFERRSV